MSPLTTTALRVVVPEDPAVTVVISGRDDARPFAGSVGMPRSGAERSSPEDGAPDDGHPHAVLENRAALARAAGVAAADVVWAEQVHGAGVATVTPADRGRGARTPHDEVPGVDALVTRVTGVAVAVRVADCVPVVLVDPGRGVAAVHAGRAGLAADAPGAALRALTADPGSVVAVIGPAIGGCCYEVGQELRDELVARHPAAAGTTTWGTPSLDLPAATAARLRAQGVARLEEVGGCTRCDPGWFSHRASRPSDHGAPVGRQAALVVRHPRPASGEPGPTSLDWPR